MVTLVFEDGHAERHPELGSEDMPAIFGNNVIELCEPEDIALFEILGLLPTMGYDYPKQAAA